MTGTVILAILAMIANASLAASALELNVGNDAARTVVSTVDLLAGAGTWSKEVAVDEMVGAAVRGGVDNADDWTDFIRLPLLGLLISEKNHGLSALDSPEDGRNDVSYYACLKSYQGSVFVFDVADDGLLLQRVAQIPFDLDYDYLSEDPGPVPSKGRFMAVHNDTDTDQVYTDYLRVIFHSDSEQAAVWQMVWHEGKQYLQIKANRAASASETVGWYVAMPIKKGVDISRYVGVTPYIDKALPMQALPLHYIYKK